MEWQRGTRINIVDTPGHADFGGEVERILSMVDGVILLVDSSEGAMPQTKFVTGKALALGLRPIVVVNKIDRPDERARKCSTKCSTCSSALDATDEQLDFPVLYASGRNGYASDDIEAREGTLTPLFETIVDHVPPPTRLTKTALQVPRHAARPRQLPRPHPDRPVQSGTVKVNQPIHALDPTARSSRPGRASKIMAFRGLERVPVEEAKAGDIISIAGLTTATVANTIADPAFPSRSRRSRSIRRPCRCALR
ncbi:MAG: GTP-binding protein [Sphingobium sp.]|nr:GTP-binding protein [Sphingobium sp.]